MATVFSHRLCVFCSWWLPAKNTRTANEVPRQDVMNSPISVVIRMVEMEGDGVGKHVSIECKKGPGRNQISESLDFYWEIFIFRYLS